EVPHEIDRSLGVGVISGVPRTDEAAVEAELEAVQASERNEMGEAAFERVSLELGVVEARDRGHERRVYEQLGVGLEAAVVGKAGRGVGRGVEGEAELEIEPGAVVFDMRRPAGEEPRLAREVVRLDRLKQHCAAVDAVEAQLADELEGLF